MSIIMSVGFSFTFPPILIKWFFEVLALICWIRFSDVVDDSSSSSFLTEFLWRFSSFLSKVTSFLIMPGLMDQCGSVLLSAPSYYISCKTNYWNCNCHLYGLFWSSLYNMWYCWWLSCIDCCLIFFWCFYTLLVGPVL